MAAITAALIGLLVVSSVLDIARGNAPGMDIISDKFEICPQYSHLKNTITNLTMWNPPDEDILYISGSLVLHVVLEDSPDFKYVMKLKKCLRQDWTTCEKYIEFEVEKMCENLPKEDSAWSGMVKKLENFDPHCPIQKGTYHFEDAPIDTSELKKVKAAEGNWQIEMRTTYKGEVLFCVIGNAKIKRKQGKRGTRERDG